MADTEATSLPQSITGGERQHPPGSPDFEALVRSWQRSLRAANKATQTIRDYLRDTRRMGSWLHTQGMPTEPAGIHREHVEAFVIAELARTSQSTAASAYRRVQQFFRWLVAEGEITVSPMVNMSPPHVDETPVPVIPLDRVRALFDDAAGPGFEQRRDSAILRVLFDTGMRRAECAGIAVGDVDLDAPTVQVRGKGGKYRVLPLGAKAVVAIDRYLRVRARHRHQGLAWLWLGQKGRLTDSGVGQMVERRCVNAGIEHLRPHQFRHTLAHRWQLADGNENDLMEIMGWESRDMLKRYGRSARAERARVSHRRLALGDEI